MSPEQNTEEQEKLLTKIKKFITDTKGEISKVDNLGKKELVYPISQKRVGFFSVVEFSTSGEVLLSLRQKLQLEKDILRFLLVAKERTPSPAPGGVRRPKED